MRRLLLVGAVLLTSSAAQAQTSEQKAAAAAAFDHAKELEADGKTAEACDEFEKSQELDPQLGTQYNLALCYEKLGKLASAYGEFDELAHTDTNAKRKKASKTEAAALKKRLTNLTLIVNDPAPSLVVKRDADDVTLLVGVTTPVDPGTYTFEASAPGYQTWSQKVDLTAEGATITVEIPPLEKATADPDDDHDEILPPGDGGSGKRPPPTVTKRAAKSGKGRKMLALGVGGAGVVATGVGLFFGFQASQLTSDAKALCNGSLDPCSGDVVGARSKIKDAKGKAMLSNIAVGVGIAALAGGLVLYLTAPSGGGAAEHAMIVPTVSPDGAGVVFDGRF